MMRLIRHRVNTLRELAQLAPGLGAEIDLRSFGEDIVLNHEPFQPGDKLSEFLKVWSMAKRGTLILNPKEDGLEKWVIPALAAHKVEDYFFLDLPHPTIVRLTVKEGQPKVALRVSAYETVESALTLAGKADWVWLDCFSGQPLSRDVIGALKGKFKLCAVSPELHAFPKENIAAFLPLVPDLDAVCTKHPDMWAQGGSRG